ncbi:dehydrase and lipid transport-domain-containing protein [Elsinoe ampelina]|uniref:Dehydrase and lipid transport-domain-containing protein n=1 Tax=Elsinoe ampelina TaxID=302913 RepID=A0A6A6G940_9PEZI|nr:dehydrase and lipid transport-domain-containing protein [Elsinoe ampelina]
MATARAVRPWLSSSRRIPSTAQTQTIPSFIRTQTRSFTNPLSNSPQVLTTQRTVPYPAKAVYEIISDIGSYHSFIPFCSSSNVTKQSKQHPSTSQTYPEEATLVISFSGGISQSFTSRVHCVPYETVEAISGPSVETSLSPKSLEHHNPRPSADSDPSRKSDVLTHLRTTWELRPFPFKPGPLKSHQNPVEETGNIPAQEQTEVVLNIEYRFTNPIYEALSAAAAPKVAEYMVEAFEKRIQDKLHRPAAGVKTRVIKH